METILLGTRKGLLVFQRASEEWSLTHEMLPGIPVSYSMVDHRNHMLWVCTDHGHWSVKLYRAIDLSRYPRAHARGTLKGKALPHQPTCGR